ncbi:MAG TPA: hypothetical protein VHR66_01425 [Gemmataceae bacterium]|jgi:hypothetical protein|nr:hypothetical protein [Gemmataceae bacterium]
MPLLFLALRMAAGAGVRLLKYNRQRLFGAWRLNDDDPELMFAAMRLTTLILPLLCAIPGMAAAQSRPIYNPAFDPFKPLPPPYAKYGPDGYWWYTAAPLPLRKG